MNPIAIAHHHRRDQGSIPGSVETQRHTSRNSGIGQV